MHGDKIQLSVSNYDTYTLNNFKVILTNFNGIYTYTREDFHLMIISKVYLNYKFIKLNFKVVCRLLHIIFNTQQAISHIYIMCI